MKLLGLFLIRCVFTKKTESAKVRPKIVKTRTGKNRGLPKHCAMCMHVHYYVLTSIVLQMGCKKGKSWSSTFGLHFASLGHKEFKIGLLQSLILLHLLLIVSIHCLYWLQWDWMLNSEPETQFKLCWQILSHYVVRNWPAKNSKALRIVKVAKIQSVFCTFFWLCQYIDFIDCNGLEC